MTQTDNILTNQNIKPLIVIPTFNNSKTIRDVVDAAIKTGLKVLVVNDGSTDNTMDCIKNFDIERVNFTHNQGKGAAIKAAAEWARENNFSHIITIDSDGQHNPAEVNLFIQKIYEKPLAIIIGNRDFHSANAPNISRFGRKFSNFWIKISSGLSVPDSQSGYRSYPVVIFDKIKCSGKHFDFEVEIIVKSVWAGIEIETVHISVNYTDETKHGSKFHPFIDNLRISWIYTKLVSRNLIPIPHKRLFNNSEKEKLTWKNIKPFLKSLLKEKTSTLEIANACMVGIIGGTLPFIGFHGLAVIFFATRFKLNRIIAYNISHLCAPPFVPFLSIEFGYLIRNGHLLTTFNMQTIAYEIHQRFFDFLLGSILIAPILGIIAWILAYFSIIAYRKFMPKRETNKIA